MSGYAAPGIALITNQDYISGIILVGMPHQTGRGLTAPAFAV
jgi:hypothetical protein